jgi:P27 family predicted phage terminase small subunit
MRGRRPKPTRLRKLEGNPGKRPINPDEPEPPAGIVACPEYLDASGKREWGRIYPLLTASKILTELDATALGAYCQEYSKWIAAEEKVKKLGSIVTSPSGYPILNPYVSLGKNALQAMHRFLVEFGMTPASRSRLRIESKSDEQDPLDAFLSRGKKPGEDTRIN